MGGHATHDEREARQVVPAAEFEYWGKRDPIGLFEAFLAEHGVTRQRLETIEQRITEEVNRAGEEALASREQNEPAPETAVHDVYAEPV